MSTLTSRRALAALTAAALPLAACGSSASNGPSTSAKTNSAVAFASCMRSHGVPNFPDQASDGGGAIRFGSLNGHFSVNGVTINAPAFKTAMQACRTRLPNGGQPVPLSASRRNAMLAFSKCMRGHGVSGFPDPTFAAGGAQLRIDKGSGIDPNSPAFKSAQQACSSILGKGAAFKTGP